MVISLTASLPGVDWMSISFPVSGATSVSPLLSLWPEGRPFLFLGFLALILECMGGALSRAMGMVTSDTKPSVSPTSISLILDFTPLSRGSRGVVSSSTSHDVGSPPPSLTSPLLRASFLALDLRE